MDGIRFVSSVSLSLTVGKMITYQHYYGTLIQKVLIFWLFKSKFEIKGENYPMQNKGTHKLLKSKS